MSSKPKIPSRKPTDAELAILQVLWHRGPSTVREAWEAQGGEKAQAYTTVLKFLQIMHEKGLVTRDESAKTHIYAAAVPAHHMKGHLVKDLLDRLFQGSVGDLVLNALGAKKVSRQERDAIRKLLDESEKTSP